MSDMGKPLAASRLAVLPVTSRTAVNRLGAARRR